MTSRMTTPLYAALMLGFVALCALWTLLLNLDGMADGMREGFGWYITLGQAAWLSCIAALAGLVCGVAGVLAFRGTNRETNRETNTCKTPQP